MLMVTASWLPVVSRSQTLTLSGDTIVQLYYLLCVTICKLKEQQHNARPRYKYSAHDNFFHVSCRSVGVLPGVVKEVTTFLSWVQLKL